jgi:ribosomal protein L7/L12
MNDVNQSLPAEAVTALENGSKIDAIKCVREQRGLGLKEAKEFVEQFIEANPEVKSRMNAANVKSAKISLRWLIVIVLLGIAAYKIYTGN